MRELSTFGVAGPRRSKTIDGLCQLYVPCRFYGAAVEGERRTVLDAIDRSVWLPPLRNQQVHCYTGAVTAPGDSGAALVGINDDYVYGFAKARSGLDEPPEKRCSTWSWAELVYLRHDIPCGTA
jgi:hypothetical protein